MTSSADFVLDPDERWRRYCASLHEAAREAASPSCLYAFTSGPPCAGQVKVRWDPLSATLETHVVCELHQDECSDLLREQLDAYYHDIL